MINWGTVQSRVESIIAIVPDQASIEEAVGLVENEFDEMELFTKEAEELEDLLLHRLLKILRKKRGKEIKKNQIRIQKKKSLRKQQIKNTRVGIRVLDPKTGDMKDLNDLDMDPSIRDAISEGLLDQFLNQQKKNKKQRKDDDEDEEPSSSFYL